MWTVRGAMVCRGVARIDLRVLAQEVDSGDQIEDSQAGQVQPDVVEADPGEHTATRMVGERCIAVAFAHPGIVGGQHYATLAGEFVAISYSRGEGGIDHALFAALDVSVWTEHRGAGVWSWWNE